MSDSQFDQFHQLRHKSFMELGEKAFQVEFKLGDFFQKIKVKKRHQFSCLINYIFCKFIEDLVHRVIKNRDVNNILNPIATRITPQEIRVQGTRMLSRISQNKSIYLAKLEKNLEKEAFRLFEKEYHSCAYDTLLNLKQTGENTTQLSWKKMTSYKAMWVQRVQAQHQLAILEKNGIPLSGLKGKLTELPNKYLEYLVGQLMRLKKEFLSECPGDLLGRVFKDYLTNKEKKEEQHTGLGDKKLKLESVFDHSP